METSMNPLIDIDFDISDAFMAYNNFKASECFH